MTTAPEPSALQRRLERERARRREAERIAEDATRHLYEVNNQLTTLNRQLDGVNDELRSIIYTVSHDLRNPIVTLLGYLELWSDDEELVLDGEHARDLEVMISKGRYVRALTRDLLEVSRIGRVEGEPVEVVVSEVARTIGEEVERDHAEATIEVGPLPVLHADELRIRQLLTNLVDNAVEHGGRDDVTVRIASRGSGDGGVEIEVSDDGVGIPPGAREDVFDLFYRPDHQREHDSTGIGLTICRRIVRDLGGTISVADRSPGTTFVIALPRDVVVRAPAPTAGPEQPDA